MSRTYDRRTPPDDHNPLANLLGYENPEIGEFGGEAGPFKRLFESLKESTIGLITGRTGLDFGDGTKFRDTLDTLLGFNLQDVWTGLQEAAQAFGEILDRVPRLQDLIEVLSGVEDGDVDDVGTKWLEQRARLAGMIDNFVQGLGAREGTGWSLDDVFFVGAQQKKEQAQIAAAIAQLQADQSGNNASGKSIIVNVSNYVGVPSVLTKFYDAGSGTVTNDGDTLEFSNDDGTEMFVYNVEGLTVDQGEVSLIVPRQAGTYFGSYGGRAIYFIYRANSATAPTTLTFARLNGNKLRWGCVRAGVSTLAAPEWFAPEQEVEPGSYMTARFGTQAGGDRQFQFLVNNIPRGAPVTDAAAISLIGPGYRNFGAGIQNDANDLINRVANISHIFANDNAPVPIQGVTFRAYRSSNTELALNSTAPYGLPNGALDTVDYLSSADHFDWAPTTQTLTVKVPGTYSFQIRAESPDRQLPLMQWMANIIRNGVSIPGVDIYGNDQGPSGSDGAYPQQMSIGPASIDIYCTAGTTIRPAVWLQRSFASTPNPGSIIGGGRTWFSAVLLNNTVTGVAS